MPRRRVHCSRCGPRLERLGWLERYARVTRRLAESVARLCQVLPIKHVAKFFGLGWDTVKELDKATCNEQLGPPDLDGLEVIAMDEFAIQKGHRYATVIVEPTRKRVLWVGRGRGARTSGRSSSCWAPAGGAAAGGGHGHERGLRAGGAGPLPAGRRSSTTCSTWWPSTAAR